MQKWIHIQNKQEKRHLIYITLHHKKYALKYVRSIFIILERVDFNYSPYTIIHAFTGTETGS